MESETPLHHAETAPEVNRLVAEGFSIDAPGWMGATPLHEAAQRGNAEVVEALLRHGANPNSRRPENLETPLHFAQNGEVVSLLLAYGADLEGRTRQGGTPLQWAARFGLVIAMEALIAGGADVNMRDADGETPLWHAAWTGQAQAAVLLLANGADVNAATKEGETALHKAARHGKAEVVRVLLRAGADPTLREQGGAMPVNVCAGETKAILTQAMGSEALAEKPILEAPSDRKLALEKVRVCLGGREAVTVAEQAILTRWALEEAPRVLAGVQPPYERFNEIRLCPNTDLLATVSPEQVEIRRSDNLAVIKRFARQSRGGVFTSADVSPDGRLVAMAETEGGIAVFERESGELVAKGDSPEGIACIRFDPSGLWLAATRAEQGGGSVSVFEVQNARLARIAGIERGSMENGAEAFVDVVSHVEFSPDGSALVLFETTSTYKEDKPKGWRGNVALYETGSWNERWCVSIDARLTGDKRSLDQIGCEFGFFTEVAFLDDRLLACGATRGQVLLFSLTDGTLARSVPVDAKAPVLSLAADPGSRTLWASLGKPACKLVRVPL